MRPALGRFDLLAARSDLICGEKFRWSPGGCVEFGEVKFVEPAADKLLLRRCRSRRRGPCGIPGWCWHRSVRIDREPRAVNHTRIGGSTDPAPTASSIRRV